MWNLDAFQKLVMDEKRRCLIHGLVKAHRQDGAAFDDIVVNKGQGLIALLTEALVLARRSPRRPSQRSPKDRSMWSQLESLGLIPTLSTAVWE